MRFFRFLLADKMPVWLSLASSIIAAVLAGYATYRLAPSINAKFEVQKAHAQYVMDNLKLLNSDTAELFSITASIDQKIGNGRDVPDSDIDSVRRLITRLQWRATEYETLFKDEKSRLVIKNYVASLNDFGNVLEGAQGVDSLTKILRAAKELALNSRRMIETLSAQADWSSKFDLTLTDESHPLAT